MRTDKDKPFVDGQEINSELDKVQLQFSKKAVDDLTTYINLVLKWNMHMNLVGSRHWKKILHELIADSFYLGNYLSSLNIQPDDLILDIGAGAGIPGIPLRIIWHAGQYLMIEPNQKRFVFLRVVLSQLQLNQTSILPQSLEQLNQEQFTARIILSRGFLNWKELLKAVHALIHPQGQAVIFSNHNWDHTKNICPASWSFMDQKEYILYPDLKRYFWFFSPRNEPS